jgi:hypothetical protein
MTCRTQFDLFAMKLVFASALSLAMGALSAQAFTYGSATNTYVCNGTQSDIQAAINDAAAKHPAQSAATAATIQMTGAAGGTVALGVGSAAITFRTCVILAGNGSFGPNATTVTLPAVWPGNANTSNTNAIIQISNGVWVENFAVPTALSGTPVFSVASGTTGARITGISYNTNATTNSSYFCYITCSGTTLTQVTIDSNTLVPGGGSNELIFARGPTNAWQKPDTWGSPNQIYIETNRFGLPGSVTGGYVCDLNANAIGTVRYNTIYGRIKIDGHGAATNSPERGVRQMEIYGNSFLCNIAYFQAMEIRGGASRNFLNFALNPSITNPGASDYITYTDYGCLQQSGTFNGVWLTPSNYPILDQVGEGMDVGGVQAPGGSDPVYMWLNQITYGPGSGTTVSWQPGSKTVPGNSPGGVFQVDGGAYPAGTTTLNLSTQSGSLIGGSYTDRHGTWENGAAIASDSNRYSIDTTTTNTQLKLVIDAQGLQQSIAANASPKVTSNAYTNWQLQTGNPSNTFNIASYVPGTPNTVILENRDIYSQTTSQWGDGANPGYDGTQGVNFGTTAAMRSKVPSKPGVGWWVTDQGSWNTNLPAGTSGLLYVWSGAAWVLNYTPYQYPYYQPVFIAQPIPVKVTGGTVALSVEVSNSPAYQWYLNGTTAVQGATNPTLLLTDPAAASGTYTCVATNLAGSSTSSAVTVSLANTTDVGRLTNLSYRAHVGTGNNILIAGFVVGGQGITGSESLLLRGSGPALVPFGVSGTLSDLDLELFSGANVISANNGWGGNSQIASAAAAVGAFTWTSSSSRDSAILQNLVPGPYTIQIEGQSGDTGVALAEVYDATPEGAFTPASPRLTNLSAQVQVGPGSQPPVIGFVIGGSTSMTVLLRASGPALAAFGATGTLADPQLQLSQSDGNGNWTVLGTNSGWGGSSQIAAEAASVGAFSWGDSATADSALLVTLPPGEYTAQVTGASGDSGLALVEVYEVQ